jgi:hypothetical protein
MSSFSLSTRTWWRPGPKFYLGRVYFFGGYNCFMPSRLLTSLLLTSLCLILCFASGCQPQRPTGSTRMSVPPEGSVKLLVTKVAETQTSWHFKWTIFGDRNWKKAAIDQNAIALSDVYKLNDTKNTGGCNTWEVDIDAQKVTSGWLVKETVHGSNGETATRTQTLSEAPQATQTTDSEPRLPLSLTIARLGTESRTLILPEK